MKVIEVNLNSGIKWPHKCAYCNQEATDEAKTHFRVIDGYLFVALRETTHTVNYPVCKRHKFISRFYGFVTNQAWPTGFVMVLTFPFLLSIPLLAGDGYGSKHYDQILAALYVLFIAWVLYLKVKNPVKIIKAKKNVAKVRLSNSDYASEFEVINAGGKNA